MFTKIFGDTQAIDWQALGIKMPFAPMHELAKEYELTPPGDYAQYVPDPVDVYDLERTFETEQFRKKYAEISFDFLDRIKYRVANTITALDAATPDTICINLGGGYTHAGKYPNTGYAYSLINDIIWAVDYQLEQGKTIGIIDLDFHFGGGTAEYYRNHKNVLVYDFHHAKGILNKHADLTENLSQCYFTTKYLTPDIGNICRDADKYILNLGTDWFHDDPIFGKYGNMLSHDILVVWMETIQQIVDRKIPLCITMGGGYGEDGLSLYEHLIEWLTFYEPQVG